MQIAKLKSAEISFVDYSNDIGTEQLPNKEIPLLLLHGFASSIKDNWNDTGWIDHLADAGFRVIALDNRGHGNSQKFYEASDYTLEIMANDAMELLDHLEISKAHVIGYSMGSRIAAMMAIKHGNRLGKIVFGGYGYAMIEGTGDWRAVHDGLLADSMDEVTDLRARAFRRFADRTQSDRKALAACIIGLRNRFEKHEIKSIMNNVLVAIGTDDDIAGSGQKLADLIKNAIYFPIPNRDHMRASTDRLFKQAAVDFLK